uniref:Abnormal cell migration protein 18-like fibronectin type I domain-containing protein n=1 Tax=Caenorhabditis japonica TaxID=281687 RepID=A0A8R1ER89_CAEJA
VARSTFVLRCNVTKSGWKTSVVGCRTDEGVQVNPGQTVHEGNTKYECLKEKDGSVEIRRTLNIKKKKSCGDHSIGESWVFEKNFMAKCTEKGVQVTDCISDSGIPVPLNGSLVLSGVKYE